MRKRTCLKTLVVIALVSTLTLACPGHVHDHDHSHNHLAHDHVSKHEPKTV
jgi:hypothetical protein